MLELPIYITGFFIACVAITFFFLFSASGKDKKVLFISLGVLIIQGAAGYLGFYSKTDPQAFPLFVLLVWPSLAIIGFVFFSRGGKAWMEKLDIGKLIVLHTVRVPVEVVLLWLSAEAAIPELMTFEGRNFDILSGLTAPVMYFLWLIKSHINRKILIVWNFICIALLLNIVVNAVLSVPGPIQTQAFDQPNIAILYFPFVWLPAFVVPVVLFSHLAVLRHLFRGKY